MTRALYSAQHTAYFIIFVQQLKIMMEKLGDTVVKVGSRSSELAMVQTKSVVAALEKFHPTVKFIIITMETIGDKVQDRALQKIGQTNLFTKELEKALAVGEVDLLVHSLKDVPTTLPEGMVLSAICKRENPSDAVVLHPKWQGKTLNDLPAGSNIGTSSLRRIAQLRSNHPGFEFETVRGNLNTRLRKLDDDNKYDALVLATAGLERLGWTHRISHVLDKSECMYAIGQGALTVETRSNDASTITLVECLNDKPTLLLCSAERACLFTLGGGCSVPVGINSIHDPTGSKITMECLVCSLDGSKKVFHSIEKTVANLTHLSLEECRSTGEAVGAELGKCLMDKGAEAILADIKPELDQ